MGLRCRVPANPKLLALYRRRKVVGELIGSLETYQRTVPVAWIRSPVEPPGEAGSPDSGKIPNRRDQDMTNAASVARKADCRGSNRPHSHHC